MITGCGGMRVGWMGVSGDGGRPATAMRAPQSPGGRPVSAGRLLRCAQVMVKPPSTTRVWPVT